MILAALFQLWLYFEYKIERWRYPRHISFGSVSYLPGGLVLKYTSTTLGRRDAEAEALRYVREHTTIPVPRVYASVEGYATRFVLMERVKGDCLEAAWHKLDDTQRDAVVDQLRGFV
ncbi:hypothetical protein PsYK624_157190 [Phanerochaete sordida]|uniref:Aminoglycoside phosphotransferase domain-containing protein n=1 Tax=Phanerochaete sordida TaxID=48140 RepID=A0A9P3GPR4_9APHY|nr:hypothetical protein PsYK624_157190 [Phanerochaete sordida]